MCAMVLRWDQVDVLEKQHRSWRAGGEGGSVREATRNKVSHEIVRKGDGIHRNRECSRILNRDC